MRKRLLPLFAVLILATTVANAAHARKSRRARHHNRRREYAVVAYHPVDLNTDSVSADSVIGFAQTLIGTRYRAASSNPLYGFDCSGFVSYVFKSFNVNVPRSSGDFINAGERISMEDAKPGDVILFTGTKTHHPHSIGHVGIVFSNDGDGLKFIHSTSGKEHGVTITAMDDTYKRRFVQVVRLLKQNDDVVLASK
jgi:murein DD-endopeptidase / murein LD-carboxypeptidase